MVEKAFETIGEATARINNQLGDVVRRLEALEVAVTGTTGFSHCGAEEKMPAGVIGWMNNSSSILSDAQFCLDRIEAVALGTKEILPPKSSSPAGKRSR